MSLTPTGWDRSLGTSKKVQEILTPPQPRKWRCGCLYRGGELQQMCPVHHSAWINLVKNLHQRAMLQKPKTETIMADVQLPAAEEITK